MPFVAWSTIYLSGVYVLNPNELEIFVLLGFRSMLVIVIVMLTPD
jgi:hypothetical protein